MDILDPQLLGYEFIAGDFLPDDQNEYYIRNRQNPPAEHSWRHLTYDEVARLIKNGNSCANWDDVLVEDPFNPGLIKNSFFAGLVRISALRRVYLQYHDFSVPAGITNSKIIACDIGADCAVHDCAYVARYIIRDRVILSRVDEMSTTNHAKFGEGIVKVGEPESVRITIDTINEAGGRSVYPFKDMTTGDAYLWARYRDDTELIHRLEDMTQKQVDNARGYYGEVGCESVIKSCRIIKDVNFGSGVYAKGANKLKNLTIQSSIQEPSQIGEGVELVNGIIGYGSRVFYGVKAVRFVLGNNCELKYGTRFLHSILGDNSTISCCEVLNSLMFPFHEQHHNNSFLIATLVQGQSNMAAGATVGSNHNTRGNDGEIIAGRGFWPGLSTTLKHNCHFASFVLLAKGNYPFELNIPFPFSLVINNDSENHLEIMPAYYWMYNMYALERNNKKFIKRDRRKTIIQHIESQSLAPDSVYEILDAIQRIETAVEKAVLASGNPSLGRKENLEQNTDRIRELKISVCNIESSKRKVYLLRPVEAWHAYKEMLLWYGVKTLAEYFDTHEKTLDAFTHLAPEKVDLRWVNLGGQLMPENRLDRLRTQIKDGTHKTWHDVHAACHTIFSQYDQDRAEHAYTILCLLHDVPSITPTQWNASIAEAKKIRAYIEQQIFDTKNKDYTNPFRSITYRNDRERDAVLGRVSDNAFIQDAKAETAALYELFDRVKDARNS